MVRAKPTRKYGGEIYHHYTMFNGRYSANKEARRLRATGKWKVRIAKVKDGYILFTRQK